MINNQIELQLSSHLELYDILIPGDHILRRINKLVDFSFAYDELKEKYCPNNGRNAINPIRMFKYLLLKNLYNLSDKGVVERSRYDMSFKYFLEMKPEDDVIDSSSLTKFRKQRLKDTNLLDMLISKTVEIAIEKGVLKSNTMIADSTHTDARYHKSTIKEMISKQTAKLVKSITGADDKIHLPEVPKERNAKTDTIKSYSEEVLKVLEDTKLNQHPDVNENANLLREMLEDNVDTFDHSIDKDARIGHKSATQSFYGYKTHIAMSEERIITAATITSGEAPDGNELSKLIQKTAKAGMEVEEVIADMAYSTLDNLKETTQEEIKLISKLNPCITKGMRPEEDGFTFNKDADRIQCPAGHLAVRKQKEKRTGQNKNARIKYIFDINKCKTCPQREACYKDGAKSKTYSITIKNDYHKTQEEFQQSEYFKNRMKIRYEIEAKNSELKNIHGYHNSETAGIDGMCIQGAMTIFAVNLKRIDKLLGEVCPKDKPL